MNRYQSGLELRHVRAFRAVAETLSFREAARRLGVAQPALSAQVRLLEARLGVELFNRSTRRVSLTDAGRRFRSKADALLAAAEDLVKAARPNATTGPRGLLAIWYGTQALYTVLPGLAKRLHEEAPNIKFQLTDASTEQMVVALRDERADIAFLHPPVDQRGIEVRPLIAERFLAVLPRDHPLAQTHAKLKAADFDGQNIIFWPREEGPALYDAFHRAWGSVTAQPNIVQCCVWPLATVGLAAAGLGIGFVPASLSGLARPEVVFRELEGLEMKLELAIARRARDRSAATEFLWEIAESLVLPTNGATATHGARVRVR